MKVKKDWEIKAFEDCIESVKYTPKIPSKDYKQEGLFPIISQEEELISGYWDNENDLFKLSKPVVIFGDHTRVLKYVDFDFVLGADGVKILQPKDFLNAKFFMYFLKNANIKHLGYARHYRLLKELSIPLPPLEEQKRIVKILDKKFAQLETIKANAQTNLQNAKDLFQSQLTKAFSNTSWEKIKLKDVCSYFKKQGKYNDLPYIGMEDIESKTGVFMGSEEIKTVQSSTFFFEENDVLFGRLRPYLGKVYLAEFSGHCSTEIFPIRVKNSLLPSFLKQWLLSENTINKINETCTGARMPRADMNKVLTFIIPLPPLPEQKRIVKELDTLSEKVRQLQEIYTKQIANCTELKQALLRKAFEGEL